MSNRLWAFGQMQFAHASLTKVKGLEFYKLMGSGREYGFSILPDWGVYALLMVWENEKYAEAFFQQSDIFRQYTDHAIENWTVFLKVQQVKGFWDGGNPFSVSSELDKANPLVAVITRATIKADQLLNFWKYVPTSQRPIEKGCEGLIYTKGVGEVPLLQMATFSIWESFELLKKYAYQTQEHKEAIRKTKQLNWYKEEMFIRFQPFKSTGQWGGINPLAPYLNSGV